MYAVERLSSYISRGVYVVSGPFHPFGGAVDIIVVQQPDGSFKSSPWYVKFGKFQGVLKTKEKVVDIAVNGIKAEFHMFLDHKGEAYFLTELEGEEVDTVFSPRSSSDETEEHSQSGGIEKSRSGDFDANRPSSPASTDGANTNILVKTTSRRSGILRRVFGRKSMKEDGSKTEGSSVGAEQMSSPESTEVAADLSEMKWSTDIPAIECEMVNASTFARPASEIDKGLQATDEDSMASPVHHEIVDTSSDLPTVNLETDPRYSGSFPNNPESLDEPTGSVEQLMNVSTFEVFDKCEIVSEVTDTFSLKSSVLTERIEGSVSESTTDSPQNPEFVEFKAGQNTHSGTEISSGKMCNSLSNGISEEKTECENLISLTHTETTEISTVGMNGSFERVTETLEFCYGRCEEVESHGRLLYQNSELMTEVNLQPDSTVPTVEENLCATGNVGDRDFSEFVNTKTVHENEIASLNRVAESLLPPTLHVSTFNSVETKTSQVDHQDTVTEGLPQDDNLEALPVEVLEDESPMVKLSSSHIPENDGLDLGKLSKAPLSLNQEAGVNETFDLIEETVSQSRHGPSDLGSLGPVLWKEYNGLHDDSEDCSPSPELSHIIQEAVVDSVFVNESIPPSESSEEDQLLFGDMDGLDPIGVQFKEQVSQESMQTENYPALTLDGIEDDHERINTNHASSLGKLDDEYPESSLQGLIKEFRPCSSPISILKTPVASGENDVWLPESLPIIRHIDSLKGSNASHPLSRSLDSTSENLKLGLLKQAASTLSEPGADPEHNLSLEHPRFLGAQASEELGLQSTSDPVGEPEKVIVQSSGSWLWPFPMRKSRTVNSIQPAKNDTKDSDASDCTSGTIKDKHVTRTSSTKKKVRSIIPTSEQLAALNLEEGRNIITFTFSTAVLGRQQVDARIYLWKWNTRIVVSDVDGTITKSDVLGQFMPLVGKDWSQTGVTHLFSSIKENGYQFLFLSARSISQAHLTRQFLFNLKQDGKALPDGPVVISPDGLFPSLYREVIRRAPHEFKIACLEDIKALFPPDCHPFYAGFGNRDTDEFSYLKVGIPKGKIFIINPKGQVAINRGVDTKSYTSLHVLVNGMFPAMSSAEQEDFNSWNYWKVPLPEIKF